MSRDPVAPILAQKHYPAIERRLKKVLDYVVECLDNHSESIDSVVLNEFHNKNLAEDAQAPEETEEDDENKENKENKEDKKLEKQ
jgi:glutamate racemase